MIAPRAQADVVLMSRRLQPSQGRPAAALRRRVHASDDGRLLQALAYHKDVVTCVAAAGGVAVSGSADTTLLVWEANPAFGRGAWLGTGEDEGMGGHVGWCCCNGIQAHVWKASRSLAPCPPAQPRAGASRCRCCRGRAAR